MKSRSLFGLCFAVVILGSVAVAQDQGIQAVIGNVFLQDTSPGIEQIGHAAIKGTFRAGQVFVQQGSPVTVPVVGNSTTVGAGSTVGGSFSAGQQSSMGVRGTATATTGTNFGVYGESRSGSGAGVKGKAPNIGVLGEGPVGVAGAGNTGVRGTSSGDAGVLGVNNGTPVTFPYGAGVVGQAPNGLLAGRFDGPVAIGTGTKRSDLLNIQNGGITIYNNQNGTANAVRLGVREDQTGYLFVAGPNVNDGGAGMGFLSGRPGQGWIYAKNVNNVPTAGMYESDEGYGQIEAERKFFTQPDPDDLERTIVYCCLEGPEVAAYIRGTGKLVNGVAQVALPAHFRNVCVEEGITVQLTPSSPDSEGLCVTEKSLRGFTVRELRRGRGTYEFDWEFKALRRANKGFSVYRPWDEMTSPGSTKAEAWANRLKYAKRVYGFEPKRARP